MSLAAAELGQLLTFENAGEVYALPLLRVREIVEYEPLTRLPATPAYVLGVMELRGLVVPVLDFSAKLGLGRSAIGDRSCIVLVEIEAGASGGLLGVLVDAMRGVTDLTAEERVAIEALSEAETGKSWHELEREGGTLWLLDLDAVLSESDVPERAASTTVEDAPGGAEPGASEAESA